MAVNSVAVERHLGVENFEVAAVCDDQRVDLEHLHVFFNKGCIKLAHQFDALLDLLTLQSQRKGHATTVVRLVAGGGINGEVEDFLGCLGRNFLNIHPTFGRADKADAAGRPIDEQGEVHLGLDPRAVLNIDPVDLFARRTGLMCDQCAPKHLFRFFGGLNCRFRQTHTAFVASVCLFEGPFAAATCVDLRLDHPKRAVQLACSCFRIFGLENCTAIADRCAEGFQKCFGLIFVDVHKTRLWIGTICVTEPQKISRQNRFCWIAHSFPTFVITLFEGVITNYVVATAVGLKTARLVQNNHE